MYSLFEPFRQLRP